MDLLACTIIEQSWPTFKDILKENLNMNRFICTCIQYGRKEKRKNVMNFFSTKHHFLHVQYLGYSSLSDIHSFIS